MPIFEPEYFLHVNLFVPTKQAAPFQAAVQAFLSQGGFGRIDPGNEWSLVLALRTPEPLTNPNFAEASGVQFDKSSRRVKRVLKDADLTETPQDARFFRYVHLWKLPDTRDLNVAAIMNACADDALYRLIDSFVASEEQDLVTLVKGPGFPLLPPTPDDGRFVRVIRHFRSHDLGFLYNVPAILGALASGGFKGFGQYQSVTGLLNSLTEFWHVSDPAVKNPHCLASMEAAFGSPPRNPYLTAAKTLWDAMQKLDVNEKRELLYPYISCSTFGILQQSPALRRVNDSQ